MTEDQKDRMLLACYIGFVMILFVLALVAVASARDLDGRYAASPLRDWFQQLHSHRGLCCDRGDGNGLSVDQWKTKDGHYQVFVEGEWREVPDDAVVTEPNRAGTAMVWMLRGYNGFSIQCFMPGSLM